MENDKIEKEVTNSKLFVKNVIFVVIGNVFNLLSGVLVGFVIPKIMGVVDYGYYKTFTLYLTYVGIFHFGFCDGIYLLFAGYKYDELDKCKFRTYTKFFVIFQLVISSIVTIISLCFITIDYGFIFLFVAISLFSKNLTTYYQYISQVTGRFKELSFRNIINSILTIISVVFLFLLVYFGKISYLNYKIYIIINTGITIMMSLWYVFTYRNITFGHSSPFSMEKKQIKKFFYVGFFLMIANLISTLTFSLDRQFVSVLFDKATYGIYAFAYNMLTLITTVVSAISVVLYPQIKKFDEEKLKDNYKNIMSIIIILLSLSLLAYYPLEMIVKTWLKDYIDSLDIFKVILPGLIPSSCISMVMFNYYKSLNKSLKYFIICVFIFILSFVANLFAYLVFKTPISISIVSIFVIIVWYLVSEFEFVRRWKIYNLKNLIFIIIVMSSFYLCGFLIDNFFVSLSVFLIVLLILIVVFWAKFIYINLKKFFVSKKEIKE